MSTYSYPSQFAEKMQAQLQKLTEQLEEGGFTGEDLELAQQALLAGNVALEAAKTGDQSLGDLAYKLAIRNEARC